MDFIKNFIKDKTVAFYVACGAAVLSLVAAIVYAATLGHLNEMSWAAFALLLALPFVFAGLALIGHEKLGAAAIGIMGFIAFVLYITTIYNYPMTQLMVISSLGDLKEFPAIVATAALMLIVCITGNVVYWMRLCKKPQEGTDKEVKTNE